MSDSKVDDTKEWLRDIASKTSLTDAEVFKKCTVGADICELGRRQRKTVFRSKTWRWEIRLKT